MVGCYWSDDIPSIVNWCIVSITVEMYLKCEDKNQNQAIFIEPKSKTCLVIVGDEFCVTVKDDSYMTPVPSDFYDGNVKHIVIVYEQISDKCIYEIYINGQKMAKKIAFREEIDYFRHEFKDYYGNYRKNHRSAA